MEARLPLNLNLVQHVQVNSFEKYFKNGINLDHAKYLLAQITEAPASNDDLENEMKAGFVPLSSDILQDKVPNYKRYWEYFEATGVVEINHKYRPKVFFPKDPACKSYRFARKYQGELASVPYSQRFAAGLVESQRKKLEAEWSQYWHLIKWLLPERNKLQIDLLAISDQESPTLLKEALDDWYLTPAKNYKSFAEKYPTNVDSEKLDERIEMMRIWCIEENISHTPTFYINGYQLPKMYNLSEVKAIFLNPANQTIFSTF